MLRFPIPDEPAVGCDIRLSLLWQIAPVLAFEKSMAGFRDDDIIVLVRDDLIRFDAAVGH